jgi:uncharacterized protein YjaG (DUF416 family)
MSLDFFNWHNPSSCTMALESIQSLTAMSNRNLSGGKGWPAHKADYLTVICEPSVQKMWEFQCLTTLWASTAYYRDTIQDIWRTITIFKKKMWKSIQLEECSFYYMWEKLWRFYLCYTSYCACINVHVCQTEWHSGEHRSQLAVSHRMASNQQ